MSMMYSGRTQPPSSRRLWMLSSRRAACFVLCYAWKGSVEATLPNDNNPRFNGPQHEQQQQQQQHIIYNRQLEFDPMEETLNLSAETESLAFYSDTEDESSASSSSSSTSSNSLLDDGPEPSAVVAASTLTMYDDTGCFVSAQALMCHGGDSMLHDSEFIFNIRRDDEEDDDDEDDDRDDDDGHSSMLSNASLRRTPRMFTTVATSISRHGENYSSESSSTTVVSSSSSVIAGESSTFYITPLSTRFTAATIRYPGSTQPTAQLLRLRGGSAKVSISKPITTSKGTVAAASLGSEFAKKLLVAALMTLVYEALLGHILEFIKIVMQTSPPHTTYWDVIQSITAEKGLAGLWDGFCPWGILQSIFKGGVFGLAYAMATKLLQPLTKQGILSLPLAVAVASGLAGGCQGYVLSPTLLLKTRVMTDPVFRNPMSLLQTTVASARIGWDVVHVEGIRALMKGANLFALKRVFDWATRYFFSDLLESWLKTIKRGTALTATDKSLASFLGGTVSTLSTLPLDVMVAKTQDAKKAGVKVAAWKLFQDDLREGGWSGLRESYMRGFAVRLAHVCLTTVVIKTGSPIVYEALFGKS